MVGSDTSGFEVNPPAGSPGTGIPVHRYLLVDQGVHLGEFHYLEGLEQAKAYTFCYIAGVNKIKGAAAGFALRPLALRSTPRVSPFSVNSDAPVTCCSKPKDRSVDTAIGVAGDDGSSLR